MQKQKQTESETTCPFSSLMSSNRTVPIQIPETRGGLLPEDPPWEHDFLHLSLEQMLPEGQ